MMLVSKSMYRVTGPVLYNHVQVRDVKTFLQGISQQDLVGHAKTAEGGKDAKADLEAGLAEGPMTQVEANSTTPLEIITRLKSKAELVRLIKHVDLVWKRQYGGWNKYSEARYEYHALPIALPAFRHIVRLSFEPPPPFGPYIDMEDRPNLAWRPIPAKRPDDGTSIPTSPAPGSEVPIPDDLVPSTVCVVAKDVRGRAPLERQPTSPKGIQPIHPTASSSSRFADSGDVVKVNIVHQAVLTDFTEQYLVPGCRNRLYFCHIGQFYSEDDLSSFYAYTPHSAMTNIAHDLHNAWKDLIQLQGPHTSIEFVLPCHQDPDNALNVHELEKEIDDQVDWMTVGDWIDKVTVRRQDPSTACPACPRTANECEDPGKS